MQRVNPARVAAVAGSLRNVLLGTLALRFGTGLTGTLIFYYLADLPSHGGPHVSPLAAGIIAAMYFAAELLGSPFFGWLSDRRGAHTVMQPGPLFGLGAVVVTPFTTSLVLLGVLRFVEGLSAAASIPSILGYIALASSGDEGLRGRIVARFEAATLVGIGLGVVAAGLLYSAVGLAAFVVNALVYATAFLIFRYGVMDITDRHRSESRPGHTGSLGEYRVVLRSAGVWLLAPTWIVLNAVLGAWSTQTVFQLVEREGTSAAFPDQMLMGGLEPYQVSLALGTLLGVFFVGLFYWGSRFRRFRRTTIIAFGLAGGLGFMVALLALNHSAGWSVALQALLAVGAVVGLFVMAGATPAALGLLADFSEGFPGQRGMIMGLYSVFLAVGQILGAVLAGAAAGWRGLDGMLLASIGLLLVALIPIGQLRQTESGAGHLDDQSRAGEPVS